MQDFGCRQEFGWAPWVNYAESTVNCTVERAWRSVLNYAAWNPSFAGATVTPVHGERNAAGEVVRISKPLVDIKGDPLPEFFAETVKVVPQRHIVWYVYKQDGESFRHFVDFGVSPAPAGVNFKVSYYGQSQLSAPVLAEQIERSQSTLQKLVLAFKAYCETHD